MHRCLRLLALASAAFCLVPSAHSQSASNTALPLPENYFPALKTFLDTAVKQSPRMIARATEQVIAEQNRIVARSGQLPQVWGSFTYYPIDRQYRAGIDGTLDVKRLGYNFSINQPIFYWGALRNNTKIGELQVKIAQGQTAEAYRLLANEIRGQYLLLIVKKAALSRARFSQQIADDQLALARTKREKNVISEADMFNPTIAAEQARLWTDRVQDDMDTAKIAFAKLCGVQAISDEEIPDSVPAVTPVTDELDQLIADFTSHSEPDTYALRTMKRQIDVEHLNYDIAAARLRPKVAITAGVTQDQQRYSLNDAAPYEVRDYLAGVTVSWSIFDSFATSASKRASLARRRQLEQSYRDQTADLIMAVREQKKQLEFSARNLAITEKLLSSSQGALNQGEEDMKRGLRSEAEVSAVRLSFYNAQIVSYQARNEYLMKVADFLSTILKDPALANVSALH